MRLDLLGLTPKPLHHPGGNSLCYSPHPPMPKVHANHLCPGFPWTFTLPTLSWAMGHLQSLLALFPFPCPWTSIGRKQREAGEWGGGERAVGTKSVNKNVDPTLPKAASTSLTSDSQTTWRRIWLTWQRGIIASGAPRLFSRG